EPRSVERSVLPSRDAHDCALPRSEGTLESLDTMSTKHFRPVSDAALAQCIPPQSCAASRIRDRGRESRQAGQDNAAWKGAAGATNAGHRWQSRWSAATALQSASSGQIHLDLPNSAPSSAIRLPEAPVFD